MKLSIHELRNRIEAYLSAVNTARYRRTAGLAPESSHRDLRLTFAELFRPDTFQAVRDLSTAIPSGSDEGGFAALLEFLAERVEEHTAREAADAVAALETGAKVAADGDWRSVREVAAALPRETSRERREQLERTLDDFLWENQDPYARRIEAARATAVELGYSGYLSLREATTGLESGRLARECEEALVQTDDAYRDLLTYALKRADPTRRLEPPRTHDLERAVGAPWMTEHFPREDLLTSVTRCLNEMGLPPHAEGRILLDAESREGKSERSLVAALHVPDDIRWVVQPEAGLEAFGALLHQSALAQQWANIARSRSMEARWLRERSLLEAFALLFEHFLTDAAWSKRYLRLAETTARDAARLAAFAQLVQFRTDCAQLPYELAVYARGPVRPLSGDYQERMSAALRVLIGRGRYLFHVRPGLRSAQRLVARALEAPLHRWMEERFNEDYWRNPAAGRWLKELFARGPRRTRDIPQELKIPVPTLKAAGERLIQILGA